MSDELDKIADALRNAEPKPDARARGVAAAMAAFEDAFAAHEQSDAAEADAASEKKSLAGDQGVAPALRPRDRNKPASQSARRARSGRRTMSRRLSKRRWMLGGAAIGLAAVVIAVGVSELSRQIHDDVLSRSFREDGVPSAASSGGLLGALSMSGEADEAQSAGGGDVLAMRDLIPKEALRQRARSQLQDNSRGLIASDPVTGRAGPAAAATRGDGMVATTAGAASPRVPALKTERAPTAVLTPEPPATVEEASRDRFEEAEPSPVKSVALEPVSTFSIDVDTASYAFMRGALNAGRLPPRGAIRIEELINYFPYDYDGPESVATPFRASVSVAPTPWNDDTKLMHLGIKGYDPAPAERPKANIVFLIDTSGSMSAPNKLPLLINAFRLLLDSLEDDDVVSIVTYAGAAGRVLEPTSAAERSKIRAALDALHAGGSTAGAAGLRLAYETARESFDPEAVNRVILATDGDFNVGFASPEEMKAFVERERDSGVFLSVLGFGRGNYHDALMQALAQNGNGVAAYIDTLSEARKVLVEEVGGALIPIAKDVKIQVEFNPAVISEYRLIGYETRALRREDFNDDTVDAGDIGAGHTVTAIYELTPKGSPAELLDPLR